MFLLKFRLYFATGFSAALYHSQFLPISIYSSLSSAPTIYRSGRVTVHSVPSNTLRDAQNLCYRINSRSMSRIFRELRSQKTPRGIFPVDSNAKGLSIT